MNSMKLRFLKPSTLTVTLNKQKPLYIFIKGDKETSEGSQNVYQTSLNPRGSGFANLTREAGKINN